MSAAVLTTTSKAAVLTVESYRRVGTEEDADVDADADTAADAGADAADDGEGSNAADLDNGRGGRDTAGEPRSTRVETDEGEEGGAGAGGGTAPPTGRRRSCVSRYARPRSRPCTVREAMRRRTTAGEATARAAPPDKPKKRRALPSPT